MRIDHRGRHRGGPHLARYVIPIALLVLCAVALAVAWSTWQSRNSADPAVTGARGSTPDAHAASRSATSSPSARPTTAPAGPQPSSSASSSPSQPPAAPVTRVVVLNASGRAGAANKVASTLVAAGWRVDRTAIWSSRPPATTVYYPPGQRAAAVRVAAVLGVERINPRYRALPRSVLVVVIS